ncbi:MAG: DedA family protein, partial [Olsenella sp.]|nr:DedA family protein [Olsenella sp.]
MQATMLALIGRFGYAALAALVFLENVFPPIPSEVILPAAGFFASIGTMTLPGAIVAATVGSLLGAYALFGVGRLLSEERLRRLMGSRPMHALGFR